MRAMKDSGIEWIGEIPEDWGICRLKNYVGIMNGQDYKDVIAEEGYPVIGSGGQFAYATAYLYEGESVLLGRKGTIDKPRYVDGKFWTVDTMYYTIPKSFCYAKFFYYLCTLINFGFYQYGSAVPSMTQRDLNSVVFPLITVTEQQRIATYLDSKCSKIDTIIAKQQQIIEKLKEYKQAVITEAVTKGLNPDVPMKDSGIEWIGEIPEHWEVSRVKNEMTNLDNLRQPISAENRNNKWGLYDYYGASGIIDRIDSYNVEDEVLLIGEDGANLVMRNLPLVYKANGKFWVNNHAHILKVKEDNVYDYMALLMEAGDYTRVITGSAQPKLSQSNLMGFRIVKPPKIEQECIARHINKKCRFIDKSISKREQLITKLQEYKKSLIYEVVTGKREVPDA